MLNIVDLVVVLTVCCICFVVIVADCLLRFGCVVDCLYVVCSLAADGLFARLRFGLRSGVVLAWC